MTEPKTSKFIIMKVIVGLVVALSGFYAGDNLLDGESLATIDNIIAGGISAASVSTLLIVMILQNFLPTKTATNVATSIVPIITDSNLSLEEKVLSLGLELLVIKQLLLDQNEIRDNLLNEDL